MTSSLGAHSARTGGALARCASPGKPPRTYAEDLRRIILAGDLVTIVVAGAASHLPAGNRYTLEDSVYVAAGYSGKGVGTALLTQFVDRCQAQSYRQMIAVIGDSGNAASVFLHRKVGFEHAGLLRAVGFKLGRWVDTVYMQRSLGRGDGCPPGL